MLTPHSNYSLLMTWGFMLLRSDLDDRRVLWHLGEHIQSFGPGSFGLMALSTIISAYATAGFVDPRTLAHLSVDIETCEDPCTNDVLVSLAWSFAELEWWHAPLWDRIERWVSSATGLSGRQAAMLLWSVTEARPVDRLVVDRLCQVAVTACGDGSMCARSAVQLMYALSRRNDASALRSTFWHLADYLSAPHVWSELLPNDIAVLSAALTTMHPCNPVFYALVNGPAQ